MKIDGGFGGRNDGGFIGNIVGTLGGGDIFGIGFLVGIILIS